MKPNKCKAVNPNWDWDVCNCSEVVYIYLYSRLNWLSNVEVLVAQSATEGLWIFSYYAPFRRAHVHIIILLYVPTTAGVSLLATKLYWRESERKIKNKNKGRKKSVSFRFWLNFYTSPSSSSVSIPKDSGLLLHYGLSSLV